jgi:hypothetical protein
MPSSETKLDRPRTEYSLGRAFLNAGIAALVFVLSCAGLNALLPFPEIDVLSSNLRFFQQHRDDFDTVFIGSSRFRHQISPGIFDRTMREAGLPTRSFNLGIDGMVPPEDGYVLEHLLGAKPRRLKWVFIELDELQTKRVPLAEGTRRRVYWHDLKRTALVIRAIHERGGYWEARELLLFHGALFVKNFTNVGRKIDFLESMSRLWKEEAPSKTLGPDGDGYVPLSWEMTAAQAAVYETDLKNAVADSESRFVSASAEHAYRQVAEEVRRAGAIPILLITPLTMQIKLGFRPESGIADNVMSFNDAGAYPQLYRKEMRLDGNHLNSVAAEEFTRLVAENFSRLRRENRIQ